jgi:hypothetical protein
MENLDLAGQASCTSRADVGHALARGEKRISVCACTLTPGPGLQQLHQPACVPSGERPGDALQHPLNGGAASLPRLAPDISGVEGS